MRKHFNQLLGIALMAAAAFVVGCEADKGEEPSPLAASTIGEAKGNNSALHNKTLAEVRRATARFHRVEVAEAAGYVLSSPCISSPAGGMGHHYVNGNLVDGLVDPSQPEALVYEPQKNGKMKLVAVEFLVVAEAWDAVNDEPPVLGTQVYDDHRNDPETNYGGPGFPNYQLHAWVWQNNPSGMHAPFNPTVTCDFELQE
ncbi:hypothetical protein [Pontibacter burrus]|uniref:Uncharacterized protein n=1 Tax=Pontibacter burrus TaxID=2704466 RepID=A0A6B3LUF3_9BACT|nr:hypothetical protein [Pontibacter burrus]NEM97618.1 hypothetical protein [Pontibacter burrus]